MIRSIFRSIICGAVVMLLSAQYYVVPPTHYPVRSGIIAIHIESDNSVYRVDEPIKLRVTLINKSGEKLDLPDGPPYVMTNLEVFDDKGKGLSSTGQQGVACGNCGNGTRSLELDPGKPVIIGYFDPDGHWSYQEWANIRHWGYDITRAGNYTLVVAPSPNVVVLEENGASGFAPSPGDRSNAVRIRVAQ